MERAGDCIATGVGDGENLAPGIVGIPGYHIAVGVEDCNHVALEVFAEGVPDPVVADGTDASISIVVIVQMVGSVVPGLVYQIACCVTVENSIGSGIFPCAQARFIVTILYHGRAFFQRGQILAVVPGHIGDTRTPVQRVADGVIGDGIPAELGNRYFQYAVE